MTVGRWTMASVLVCLWATVAAALAPLGPDEWRFLYGPFSRDYVAPQQELQHARQMGYRYIAYSDIFTAVKDFPEGAGMRQVHGDPFGHMQGAESTSTPQFGYWQRINLSSPPAGSDRTFIEKYACWKSTAAWPNNIATGWWFNGTTFQMTPDVQQQEVIDELIANALATATAKENVASDVLFGGHAHDVADIRGYFYSVSGGSQDYISNQTGTNSCVNHSPFGSFEYATYEDGMAALHKQMWAAMRAAFPKFHIYIEPWLIYEYWIAFNAGRSDAQQLTPSDMLLMQESPGTQFVDDSRNFVLGVTKDRVGSSTPDSCDEPSVRTLVGKAGSNGSWYGWDLRFGGSGNCPDYQRIDTVPARLQLAKVIPGWENLMNVPLAGRSWNGTLYQSANSYVSPNVMASRHPVTRKIFAVFHNTSEAIPLNAGESVTGVQCTDALFIESGACNSHLQITGTSVQLTGAGQAGVGYIITLNAVAPDTTPPAAPTGFRVN